MSADFYDPSAFYVIEQRDRQTSADGGTHWSPWTLARLVNRSNRFETRPAAQEHIGRMRSVAGREYQISARKR